MKKYIYTFFFIAVCLSLNIFGQIPTNVLVQIVKTEDARRYDAVLANLLKSRNPQIRKRAALAAGRIGNDAAVPVLADLLENEMDAEIRAMAAFALGEIESIKAAEAILRVLGDTKTDESVRARATEAAGKIAAANAKDEKAKALGKAIVENLEFEAGRRSMPSRVVILMGLTAVLRARPEGGEAATAKFLNYSDARIRADAANALSRLRAKNANDVLRKMLQSDADAVARANAARALGAAEDKDSFDVLLDAALKDADSRVRVSATRSVGALKDKKAAEKLTERGENLLSMLKTPSPNSQTAGLSVEKNELLEIAAALGRILPNANDKRAVAFLDNLRQADKYRSPETEIALARIAPQIYVQSVIRDADGLWNENWRVISAEFQGLGEIANLESNKETDAVKSAVRVFFVRLLSDWLTMNPREKTGENARMAMPDLVRAFAAFKSENTSGIFRPILEDEPDVFIRAAIAEVLGEQPASKENFDALRKAFEKSLETDKVYNDAQFATLSALVKTGKSDAEDSLRLALTQPNYLLRRHAANLVRENNLTESFGNAEMRVGNVNLYQPKSGTKLGQVLNMNADYLRAVSRKNGSVKAVLTTEKGAFTIEFAPEDAPLTVDNFIKLARAGYFNGLAVHRVVPNFVMQDGDPRGDGNGGPGWEIRCEINMLPYDRGAVGMALSGKDTGGSQWFATHSPQPHLDGGYTVFGRVNETDMKVVDKIVRGDRILSVKIVESKPTRR